MTVSTSGSTADPGVPVQFKPRSTQSAPNSDHAKQPPPTGPASYKRKKRNRKKDSLSSTTTEETSIVTEPTESIEPPTASEPNAGTNKPTGNAKRAKSNLEPKPEFKLDGSHLKQVNDLTKGMKWLKEKSKVFVVIDLELWEVSNKFLTEIGIAVYDPTSIPDGTHYLVPQLKACHFVVEENKHRVNGRHVPNNMFNFSYGQTLIMKIAECRVAVNRILASLAAQNNLVILGHGVSGDIRVLQQQGFTIPKHEVLDTNSMWRITRPEGFGSLTKLLIYFRIPHGLMHNAGNDAYMNLLLFLVLCDPVVRKERKLDQLAHPDDLKLVSTAQEKKGQSKRRKDMQPSSRFGVAKEAVDLMFLA